MLTRLSLSLLLCAAVAAADTQPVVVLAGAPRAPSKPLSPLASAMARPKRFNADSIVVDKSERRLTLYQRGAQVLAYDVALGPNPVGAKTRRGDGRTPEGMYYLEGRNPQSKYHLALRVSYPNAADRARAARACGADAHESLAGLSGAAGQMPAGRRAGL